MVGCLVPKLSMYQRLAELGDIFGNLGEAFIGTELDDKYLQRLGWIVVVGLDEMLKLLATPTGFNIVLREENQE
jgi:hypothetical protein